MTRCPAASCGRSSVRRSEASRPAGRSWSGSVPSAVRLVPLPDGAYDVYIARGFEVRPAGDVLAAYGGGLMALVLIA